MKCDVIGIILASIPSLILNNKIHPFSSSYRLDQEHSLMTNTFSFQNPSMNRENTKTKINKETIKFNIIE